MSWRNRKYALNQFARKFEIIDKLNERKVRKWWDKQSHSQQKLRRAEFRSLFNWLMIERLVPKFEYIPFTNSDDRPKLLSKEKPQKRRDPLTNEGYWKIYNKAAEMGCESLQIAMGISRYTTLRESDVCALRFDQNIVDNNLRVVVAKSVAQKGTARASRLRWNLDEHEPLRKIIYQAKELSRKNDNCPFIVSHRPKRKVWNQDKEHIC